MHYLFPFFSQDRQGKMLVTLGSLLMIAIGVLYIAYAGRNLNRYNQRGDFNVVIFKDPLVAYYMFYGIQAIFVFLFNIIENWRQYRSNEQSEPKWWVNYWLIYIQSCFTMAAAVGACGSQNAYAPFKAQAQIVRTIPGYPAAFYDYLDSWITLHRFLIAIIVITFVIGVPLMALMMYGLVQKLRTYRVDMVKDGMHRNPELELAQNKPSVTKL